MPDRNPTPSIRWLITICMLLRNQVETDQTVLWSEPFFTLDHCADAMASNMFLFGFGHCSRHPCLQISLFSVCHIMILFCNCSTIKDEGYKNVMFLSCSYEGKAYKFRFRFGVSAF
jgi:hypothetical protein